MQGSVLSHPHAGLLPYLFTCCIPFSLVFQDPSCDSGVGGEKPPGPSSGSGKEQPPMSRAGWQLLLGAAPAWPDSRWG